MSAQAIQQSGSFLFYHGNAVVLVQWRDTLSAGMWGRTVTKYQTRWGHDLADSELFEILSNVGINRELFQDGVMEELARQA